ncbi:MAG: DNA methyltransferase [Candidatus Nomurabacteria bacterium]|nr:DNA methyltransferase [Candidatus Nomurabacteria bacterium]
MRNENLTIVQVPLVDLKLTEYNPRKWNDTQKQELKDSITRFGVVDPIIVNSAESRKNIILGGHFRFSVLQELGYTKVPVVYLNIPDLEKEKELCIRLNKNQGEFDMDLLAKFDESFLKDLGFGSVDLDKVFEEDDEEEQFDLAKELAKLGIDNIVAAKGDVYDLDGSRLMCGDSTIEADMLKLCGENKIDMVMTDPPYILDYLHGKTKKNGEAVTGFGAKKNRRYLETDVLPDNFTELWMANVAKVQNDNFSIIVYENWKNIRTIWGEMEKHWKVRNMLVWHLPNRNQGYAGQHKFFSKHDIAMVGTSSEERIPDVEFEDEELVQNEYETALFAITGRPHWEGYQKGAKYCPTDFIDFNASDEKSSGQGVIFGTKPIEILIPYIKILTKRDQLVLEPFGGSGSTLIASTKLKRRCFIMEKSPVYAEVIMNRWEKLTGKKRVKIN